jgi:hypothetical protein
MPAGVVPSPWNGLEHVRGWGVFGAPFSSGHVLALRVFPQNDFAPYRTLWHRTPEGDDYVAMVRADEHRGLAHSRTGMALSTPAARDGGGRQDVPWTGFHPTVRHDAQRSVRRAHTRRLYPIVHSQATLGGVDLGHTVRSRDTPRIGGIPVSARAVLAIGRAYFEITDPDEYSRTRAELGIVDSA